MGRVFQDIEIVDFPAELSLPDSAGLLSLRFDRSASLQISLFKHGFFFESFGHMEPVSIHATKDQTEIVVPRAWIGNFQFAFNTQSPLRNELIFAALEATIHWSKPKSEKISVAFFLNGLRFLPDKGESEVINLDGFEFEFSLVDDYVALGQRIKENWNTVTAVAEVKDVDTDDLDKLTRTVEDACWLLSFAFGAGIGWVRLDTFDANGERITSVVRKLNSNDQPFHEPLLLDQLKGEMKRYLEVAYPAYRQYCEIFKLQNIIHELILVADEAVLTVQGLLLANVLEIIRYSFALNVLVPQGLAIQDGDQFKRSKPVKGKSAQLSFREILGEFANQFQLSRWVPNEEDFVQFRNKIIHEGEVLGGSFEDKRRNVLDLLHFCHCCVLALLDWDRAGGSYIPANEDPNKITLTSAQKSETKSFGINLKKFTR